MHLIRHLDDNTILLIYYFIYSRCISKEYCYFFNLYILQYTALFSNKNLGNLDRIFLLYYNLVIPTYTYKIQGA